MTAFLANSLQGSDNGSEYESMSIYENMSDWESSFLALAEAPGRPRGSYGRRSKSDRKSSGRKFRRSSGGYEGSDVDQDTNTPGGRSDRSRGSEKHPSAMGYGRFAEQGASPTMTTRFESDSPAQRSPDRGDKAERKKSRGRSKTAPALPIKDEGGNFFTGIFRGLF